MSVPLQTVEQMRGEIKAKSVSPAGVIVQPGRQPSVDPRNSISPPRESTPSAIGYAQPRQPSLNSISPKTLPINLPQAQATEEIILGPTESKLTADIPQEPMTIPSQNQDQIQNPLAMTDEIDPALLDQGPHQRRSPKTDADNVVVGGSIKADPVPGVSETFPGNRADISPSSNLRETNPDPHWTSHLLNPSASNLSNGENGQVENKQFHYPLVPVNTQGQWGEFSNPSTETNSPATPIGGLQNELPFSLGRKNGEFDSRRSSITDLGVSSDIGVGAIKGSTSSESGYAVGGHEDAEGELEEGEQTDATGEGGVPGPKQKKSHARRQPPGHIKRARNAFILFRKHVTDSGLIPPSVEVKHQNISVVAAKMWREAPQEVRQQFQEQARIEKEEHQRKYPGYRYQPVFRRTDIIRRRVRKDPAEDEKVDAVAEALIKGKTGQTLEEEIKDQLKARSDESGAESSGGSRRRRRDVGQLSKGALRAQRAQNRAKLQRQNLLGSNLLSVSMYNAQHQQAQQRLGHPGAQHHMQYAMAEQYLPVGYDMEGRPVMATAPGAPAAYGDMYDMAMGEGMYRLPPIQGEMMYGQGWEGNPYPGGYDAAPGMEYPAPVGMEGADYYQQGLGEGYSGDMAMGVSNPAGMPGVSAPTEMEYRLPPMVDQADGNVQSHSQVPPPPGERQADDRIRDWANDLHLPAQQEPSGHVMFNERLFDGALGSATLPHMSERRESDEGLAAFDEAVAQANEVPSW
ncbi:hypothetical protein M231_00929 [Tremella mesenterica]|uniref:HMG box domain-containing protein n=1 Tax=Tremella mesenterica TaxID=5217 RepID=A0A4Q1BUB2_TREME|nr:hypothetical protein M231_00929 [Tremella mesenterica]